MLIFSFGSGFNLETTNATYLAQIAAGESAEQLSSLQSRTKDVAYAHAQGIEVGGYDLICLDRGYNGYGGNVGDQWDVVEPGSMDVRECPAVVISALM